MSNLGRYLDITSMAKEAGGVDKLIRAIEKAAFQKGAGAGAVGALAVGGVAVAAKRSWDTRKARAEEAKEQLKAKVQGSAEPKE